MESNQITKCSHGDIEKNVIVTKHTKIVHKVFSKMLIFIKTTSEFLTHDSFHPVLVMVMRELNKAGSGGSGGLYGFEKKELCIQIMSLLLIEIGLPPVLAHYSASVIEKQIETVYTMGFHKWRRHHKHCVIF